MIHSTTIRIGTEGAAYDNAYPAILAFTDRAARHLAVDTTAKHARSRQRAFARRVNRLIRCLAKYFPGCEFRENNDLSPKMRQAARDTFVAHIWIIQDGKIVRCFAACGIGDFLRVLVETTEFPAPGSAWDTGRMTIMSAPYIGSCASAALLIRRNPFITYTSEI